MVILKGMAKAILSLLFFVLSSSLAQNNYPARIACELQNSNNVRMTFPRSDANETVYPYIYTLKDNSGEVFKNIISQQIVYSTEDVIILFVAAEDIKGKLGVYRIEINNALKVAKTQFLNALPAKVREYQNPTSVIPFSLFATAKGLLLFPANEIGVWKLINLNTGSVVHQWNHPIGFHNPQIKENFVSWTFKDADKTQLYVHDLKNDGSKVFNSKGEVQFLNSYKNELYYLTIVNLDLNKKIYRVLSYLNGNTQLKFELDSVNADYDNFLMVNAAIFYTSQKTISKKKPSAVLEAQLNIYDASKGLLAQKIKYATFMVELLKKYSGQEFKLLHQPLWNQNEVIFSLNEIGGLVKFNYSLKQWFYIGYPYEGNTCFNPSLIGLAN